MAFITDFADEAVLLPVFVAVALAFAASGWRRGLLAWAIAVGGTLVIVFLAKLLLAGCPVAGAPAGIASPSGHTAAAAVVLGGLAGLLFRPWIGVALAVAFAVLIGVSRVALGFHTIGDVVAGGLIGVSGAMALARFAGSERQPHCRWLGIAAVPLVLLLHGLHLHAEPVIWHLASLLPFPIGACKGG